MGAVSNRKWDFWINKAYFDGIFSDSGFFECVLVQTLMTPQTVEFLSERFTIGSKDVLITSRSSREFVEMNMRSVDGLLCLKIRDTFHSDCNLDDLIKSILETIDAISICVDASLECNRIDFISDHHGRIFSATRRPFRRGMAFEVEERCTAQQKLLTDLNYYKPAAPELKVAIQHYLTGMTLLGLEDQLSGLTDAAFMQFFQGCEALSNATEETKGLCTHLCRYIAKLGCRDAMVLQILAFHVYQVRNKYFGHGDVAHNFNAINDYELAYQLTKQLLVVRYLCKRLIDINAPSKQTLIREMRFFPQAGSEMFHGTVEELSTTFRVDYPKRKAKIYDEKGEKIEEYTIT